MFLLLLLGFIALFHFPESSCDDSAAPVTSALKDFSNDLTDILELANAESMPSNPEHKVFADTLEEIQVSISELEKNPSDIDAIEKFIDDVHDKLRGMLKPFVENHIGIADDVDTVRSTNITVIIDVLNATTNFLVMGLPDSLKFQLISLMHKLREFGDGRADADGVLAALSKTVDAVDDFSGLDSDLLRYLLARNLKNLKPHLGDSESAQEKLRTSLLRLVPQGARGGLCDGLIVGDLLLSVKSAMARLLDFLGLSQFFADDLNMPIPNETNS